MSSHSPNDSAEHDSNTPRKPAIRLTIPPRYYLLPGAAILIGTTIGLRRGARTASLQFLAENAHRPPTTVQGWYFYNKTKNYRILMSGLKEAGKDAIKLGATAAIWVGIEQGCGQLGPPWTDVSEVVAGAGTAGVFAGVCELSSIRRYWQCEFFVTAASSFLCLESNLTIAMLLCDSNLC